MSLVTRDHCTGGANTLLSRTGVAMYGPYAILEHFAAGGRLTYVPYFGNVEEDVYEEP